MNIRRWQFFMKWYQMRWAQKYWGKEAGECYRLKSTADETFFLEFALRGYDLSKLRDDETTAEILKIG